jgi:hypothetical protein
MCLIVFDSDHPFEDPKALLAPLFPNAPAINF